MNVLYGKKVNMLQEIIALATIMFLIYIAFCEK